MVIRLNPQPPGRLQFPQKTSSARPTRLGGKKGRAGVSYFVSATKASHID